MNKAFIISRYPNCFELIGPKVEYKTKNFSVDELKRKIDKKYNWNPNTKKSLRKRVLISATPSPKHS